MKGKYVVGLCLSVLIVCSLFTGCSGQKTEPLSDVDRAKNIVISIDEFLDEVNAFKVKMNDLNETVGLVINMPLPEKLYDYIYFPSRDIFIASIGVGGKEPLTPKFLDNLSIDEIREKYKEDFDKEVLKSFGAVTLNYKEMSKVYNTEKSYTVFTRHFYTADNVNFNIIDLKGKRDIIVYRKYILHKVDEGFELFDFDIAYTIDGLHEEVAKLYEEGNPADIAEKLKNDIKFTFETHDGEEVLFERY